ncbi:repressor LexA [Candidatus Roizmanbacteria bacterium RIFCSPHIGHO2_02_FULL_40_13b]|uniref:Repressor LexA n=1 Tax=Candidatus Roizmanbacteria bacterium RIFCSPHIGHO2_01_FULL_39_24 TaxID=1802032 RepID=A0A1F7GJI2_9BACT|nr:MAG: repressor LexA [Candidatus Roizmanbacteria bacterium RIFCSPHIGHO2_01_FULL_39_24]OGK26656.1 MAG: repressor LexA [Candidatus Roizmanbacteria bacterium RIFCSPHIGHO2_02_FULL_40_13b]OGK50104.1 MAG: repressor LexA [Candidatus Roizmanbacteria bacterium RIFCSPLOWO2_01_FULL_40_32]OGK55907.1 MAG: repressor LexA [Candidatus Roizmanbacteria bacterium RIFCSPLOWO2_02_FULL_39_8]
MNTEQLLSKIRKFFRTNKRLPSYQEIATLCGFASKNAAFKLTQKLIDEGFLEKDQTGKLVPKRLFALLPNTGIVKAGFPSAATEELNDLVSIDEYLITKPESTFMLTVSGDSMIDEGICPGDIVLVERGRTAKNDEIVVACVDGEWTLKYYQKKGGKVWLKAANKNYRPIYPKETLEVAGVVTSVIRKYN